MKKNRVFFGTAAFVLVVLMFSQLAYGWQKRFGGNGSDAGLCVRQAADNGYIISGSTNSFGAGDLDMYLIKTDAEGNCVWTRTFGGIGPEAGFSCVQASDGGYVAAGYIEYGVGMSYPSDMYVVKVDASGDCVWTRTFGGPVYDDANSIVQTNDNGYAIAGDSASDFYLVKTDADGDCVWTQTFDSGVHDMAYSVKQTSDGGYILAGESKATMPSTVRYTYLVKTDPSGNKSWDKNFSPVVGTRSIQQTSDGGYIFTGDYLTGGNLDVGLIKTDANGDCVWARTYGDSSHDSLPSVQQTVDGGYIMAGSTDSSGPGLANIYLIKTDSNGDCVWAKTFGISGISCGARSVQQTNDGGYIVTGDVSGTGVSLGVILVKFDANGNDEPLPTPTVTPTPAACGEGSIASFVTSVNTGSAENSLLFSFTNGPIAWAGGPGNHGTLKITVPPDWSPPSLVYNDPGNVAVSSGFMFTPSLSISGRDILVDVSGLPANNGFSITYGNRLLGGPGADAPSVSCPFGRVDTFTAETSADGSSFCPIASGGQIINILCLTPTLTFTQTPTATPVPTETGCMHRDAAFAGDGAVYSGNADIAMLGDTGQGMCIDANGKILVAGYGTASSMMTGFDFTERMFILRLNQDGTYDTTFGNGTGKFAGVPDTIGTDIAITTGGKIIVTGRNVVYRFNPDGTHDTSFGVNGVFTAPGLLLARIVIDNSGRIVITGQDQSVPSLVIMRLDPDGNADASFNGSGKAVFPVGKGFGSGVAIDNAGRIYATGNLILSDAGDMLLCRYLENGTLDTSFNGTGYQSYNYGLHDYGCSVAIDSAGKIVVAGGSNGFPMQLNDRIFAWRYNTDGSPDISFNGSGVNSYLGGGAGGSVAFDAQGNIIIAGADVSTSTPTMALWKLDNSGGLINKVVSTIPSASTGSIGKELKIDASGRLIVAGEIYRNVAEDKEAAVWVYDDSCVAIPTPTVTPTQNITATPTITATPDKWHGKCLKVINNVMHPVKGDRIKLQYRVDKDSKVTIKVCDRNGKFLTSLVDENKTAGDYDLEWNGSLGNGKSAASGMYVITIKIGNFTGIEKAAVIR